MPAEGVGMDTVTSVSKETRHPDLDLEMIENILGRGGVEKGRFGGLANPVENSFAFSLRSLNDRDRDVDFGQPMKVHCGAATATSNR